MVTIDCPDEKFKGALASKVNIRSDLAPELYFCWECNLHRQDDPGWQGSDTSMTEPGFHFLIHFDRLMPKPTEPN